MPRPPLCQVPTLTEKELHKRLDAYLTTPGGPPHLIVFFTDEGMWTEKTAAMYAVGALIVDCNDKDEIVAMYQKTSDEVTH